MQIEVLAAPEPVYNCEINGSETIYLGRTVGSELDHNRVGFTIGLPSSAAAAVILVSSPNTYVGSEEIFK